jgi:hypothetical protein
MAVDGADAGDQPVGGRAFDQVLELASASLRGDDDRPVLNEAPGVE